MNNTTKCDDIRAQTKFKYSLLKKMFSSKQTTRNQIYKRSRLKPVLDYALEIEITRQIYKKS